METDIQTAVEETPNRWGSPGSWLLGLHLANVALTTGLSRMRPRGEAWLLELPRKPEPALGSSKVLSGGPHELCFPSEVLCFGLGDFHMSHFQLRTPKLWLMTWSFIGCRNIEPLGLFLQPFYFTVQLTHHVLPQVVPSGDIQKTAFNTSDFDLWYLQDPFFIFVPLSGSSLTVPLRLFLFVLINFLF